MSLGVSAWRSMTQAAAWTARASSLMGGAGMGPRVPQRLTLDAGVDQAGVVAGIEVADAAIVALGDGEEHGGEGRVRGALLRLRRIELARARVEQCLGVRGHVAVPARLDVAVRHDVDPVRGARRRVGPVGPREGI